MPTGKDVKVSEAERVIDSRTPGPTDGKTGSAIDVSGGLESSPDVGPKEEMKGDCELLGAAEE